MFSTPGWACLGDDLLTESPTSFAGCADQTQCVFPNAVIPQNAWSPVATKMLSLGLFPQTSSPDNFFVTSAYAQKFRDDKGGIRIDQNTRFGTLFGYYFADDYLLNSPFPNGGATVPAANFAYNAVTAGRAQMINLGIPRIRSVRGKRISFQLRAQCAGARHSTGRRGSELQPEQSGLRNAMEAPRAASVRFRRRSRACRT